MSVAPNSSIRILKGVALNSSYNHTIYFSNRTAQTNWFLSKSVSPLSKDNYTYLRENNSLWVELTVDQLLGCNYIMYRNTSHENKWFYAFINSIEYVNELTSRIYIENDVLQTWMFEYELLDSFVEREHSLTDNIGDNTIPENLELGQYIIKDTQKTGVLSTNNKIVVAGTVDKDGNNAFGQGVGGSYSGLHYNVFDYVSEVNDYIELLTNANKSESIVSIFMCTDFFDTITGLGSEVININKNIYDIDGYIPKNKKLFCFPFNFLHVSNSTNNSMDLRYEFFSDSACNFTLWGEMSCNPTALLYPRNYKGIAENKNEKLSLNGYPQCSYSTDTYKVWLAQNAVTSSIQLAGSVAGSFSNGVTPVGVFNAVTNIASAVAKTEEIYSRPPQSKGNNDASVTFSIGDLDFWFYRMTITAEFAKIIDEYLWSYGYATKRIKKPNINSRPNWNFVKTIGCNLKGNLPNTDITKIKAIFDNGITFWKNGDNIGNYSLNNSPT